MFGSKYRGLWALHARTPRPNLTKAIKHHTSLNLGTDMRAMNNNDEAGQTFNVATGIPTTINQLAQLLTQLTSDKKIKPRHHAARQGDLKHS
jgi:hypothetical protein